MAELSERLANLSPAKRKLLEERLKQKPAVCEPIAIVGMACRFAGSPDVSSFWHLIRDGIDGTGEIPSTRWDVDSFYDPTGQQNGKMSVRWAGMIDDVDQFDSAFFGITPREAAKVDPQQRLLLEVAWEALEYAGYAPERMSGTATGVFVGIGGTDYSKVPIPLAIYYDQIDVHSGTGNALSIAANRLSYFFDFHGPSVAVDTACSSGMVGIHLAAQSLRNRECDAALAGGVNLILSPETTIAFSKAHMLSPDGRCRPFDAGANGYIRGEGCALLFLKRLTDAVRDGDRVLAVVRATATNQDGRTSGITAPNGRLQESVIRSAWKQAGITAKQISYIEAHGTGTPLGDPIEIEALGRLFPQDGSADSPVQVTSVKANIGHTETVSGVAGVIKVVLMMRNDLIPPQLHFEQLNPHISLDGTRLNIPSEPVAWPARSGRPRLAGVSSFGFGGSNTHIILEEAGEAAASDDSTSRPFDILTLSAKNSTALQDLAGRYVDYLAEHPEPHLRDICQTANTGRNHFNHRAAILAADAQELTENLAKLRMGAKSRNIKLGQVRLAKSPQIAFLFTGQGSQYAGMGRALWESEPAFRSVLEQCEEILRGELERPLLSVIYPDNSDDSILNETAYTQPALFAIEYALASLWRSWGIEPCAVMGHSVGEYVAACVAEVFPLEAGLKLIAHRARLMQQLPRNGSMAVVFAAPNRVCAALDAVSDRVSIAAANGPENTTISGESEAVHAVLKQLKAEGVAAQPLTVSHAFHSPLMEPMLDEFEQLASCVRFEPPKIPLASNLTGRLLDQAPTAQYWRDHIRQAVQFSEGIQRLAEFEPHAMLEIGPTASLIGMGRKCAPQLATGWLPSLRKGKDDWQTLLGSLADMYVLGARVDWREFTRRQPPHRLVLPTYPFQRSRHWYKESEPRKTAIHVPSGPAIHPLLQYPVHSAIEKTLLESSISQGAPAYLADHQVQGSAVVPAAAYIEQGLAAAARVFGAGQHAVENLTIQQAMFLPESASRRVQVTISPEMGGQCSFETYSMDPDCEKANWTMHASGTLRHSDGLPSEEAQSIDLEAVRNRVVAESQQNEFYEGIAKRGLAYGPAFQVINHLQRTDHEALSEICLPEIVQRELEQYHLHPALGDALMQTAAGLVPLERDGSYSPYTYMPVGVRRARIHAPLVDRMFVYAVRTSAENQPSPDYVVGNLYLIDDSGRILAEFSGAKVQRVGRGGAGQRDDERHDWLYQVQWQQQSVTKSLRNGRSAIGGEKTWMILADDGGLGGQLARQLKALGNRCIVVTAAAELRPGPGRNGDTDTYQIDPLEGFGQLLEMSLGSDDADCAGIVHMWSLNCDCDDADQEPDLGAARRFGSGSFLHMVQQVARHRFRTPPQLCLVTRGAVATGREDTLAVSQSPVWGMGRVAAMEHPELGCRLVDLDPALPAVDFAERLVDEVASTSGEQQIAYRGEQRLVARLRQTDQAVQPEGDADSSQGMKVPAATPFRLHLGAAGSFDSLHFVGQSRQAPEPGQVEIAVRATGLNFSDVLKAMGLYPGITDEIVPLGIECSGIVTAVGEDVQRFQVGDKVLGVAPYSFASHTRTADYALVHKPDAIDFGDAATIPITFLTAHYALVRLAQLQPSERLLIHAGAGGVGLAAIQIAQHIGAEIFATAGSEEKRQYLKSLGVRHVMNSRSLEFAEQIREITGREGIDVVLNSLPGEAIPKSLAVLRAYGRFLEIGKTDIYQNRMIGLLPFQDNLSYFAIDLDRMLRQRPQFIGELFKEVMELFESGDYRPLMATRFSAASTIDAFRYMAQRKNIGKVVVELESEQAEEPIETSEPEAGSIRADATYLITGGLGALGLQVAHWLAAQGARHLVLMSRRSPTGEALKAIDSLRVTGARVTAVQADVAHAEMVHAALQQIPPSFPPLRGLFHAAGVLADGILFDMSLSQMDKAMVPKVQGAWNLHAATIDAPLEHFVLFSSIACLLGSPGQGNYAAGNAFLDALAALRRARGLPALSVNWGPWSDSGMAAQAGRDEQIQSRGMQPLPAAGCLELMGRLMRGPACNVAVMDVQWSELLHAMSGRTPSLLAELAQDQIDAGEQPVDNAVDEPFRKQLLASALQDRLPMLETYFAVELARIMELKTSDLDVAQPLSELGLDSLMAMELKNNLERRLAFNLPMAAFMDGPSISTLASHAAKAIGGDAAAAATPSGQAASALAEEWSPLSPLSPGGELSPIFFVHPIGGDVRCYSGLAKELGQDRPVYALRPRGIDGAVPPHDSMDELLQDYAAAIQGVQPQGPYLLGGWSTGGIYAYELARWLHERGESIGLLALFDSPLPSIVQHVDLDDDIRFLYDYISFANKALGAKMDITYEQLCATSATEAFSLAMQEAKNQKVIPADVPDDFMRRFVNVCKANVGLLQRCQLTAFPQPVYLFRPQETASLEDATGKTLTADLGWRDIVGSQLNLRQVSGDHFSMMIGDNAERIGASLKDLVDQVCASQSVPG